MSMLNCLSLMSSGQTADSMKVLVLLSHKGLMAKANSLKLTEAKGSSWLSLISAMAAVSMWPTSHHERMAIGIQMRSRSFIISIILNYNRSTN